MRSTRFQNILRMISIVSLLLCVALSIWGIRSGVFQSEQAMKAWIIDFGMWGPMLFLLIQIVQVVLPILPGGISCLIGVVLFGKVKGFFYNYIGICIGSVIAFALAKSCGRPLLCKLFGQEQLQKYDDWTTDKKHFEKWFALAIFLPVAPDDFLCYLAGTTTMSWKKFILIIFLGKPFAILIYSLLLNTAWEKLLFWIG